MRRACRGISVEVDTRDYPDPAEIIERQIESRKKMRKAGSCGSLLSQPHDHVYEPRREGGFLEVKP